MDAGDMQRKLSVWAAQDQNHRFFDLYHLLYDRDWLRLRPITCGRCAFPVISAKLRRTDRWRAGCGESRTPGSEGGVRKHDS